MSFSVTAHKLGARTKQFSLCLMLNSVVFFLCGDFIIAFLPKMVPAAMLFWLGIILVVYWVWDGVGHVSYSEHAVVIVLIVVLTYSKFAK